MFFGLYFLLLHMMYRIAVRNNLFPLIHTSCRNVSSKHIQLLPDTRECGFAFDFNAAKKTYQQTVHILWKDEAKAINVKDGKWEVSLYFLAQ